MSLDLQHALESLYGLERRKDKLGLEGTRALLGALGNPHRRFRSVHVAGTNGKGSVCAIVERVLREAGFRTGLFTSPHLVDFRERIRVNGRWADEAWLARRLEHIQSLPEGKDRTFFEVCTALAFDTFAEQRVEIAVVEVGLGGRLDCTNVITPEVSAITTVSFDHTEILGDTLEQIAAEKAGIIKPGVPVVSGVGAGRAGRTIEAIARERGAPLIRGRYQEHGQLRVPPRRGTPSAPAPGPEGSPGDRLPGQFHRFLLGTPWGERVELPLVHAQHLLGPNRDLALVVLGELMRRGIVMDWGAVRRGLARTRWPGRFERCPGQPRLWWDGAHNVMGMMKLAARYGDPRAGIRPVAIVLALSKDKDLEGILQVLHWDFANVKLFAVRSRNERAASPAVIVKAARAAGFDAAESGDVPTGVREALARAGGDPVLLTGSLFAVGEAMEAFGGAPGEWL